MRIDEQKEDGGLRKGKGGHMKSVATVRPEKKDSVQPKRPLPKSLGTNLKVSRSKPRNPTLAIGVGQISLSAGKKTPVPQTPTRAKPLRVPPVKPATPPVRPVQGKPVTPPVRPVQGKPATPPVRPIQGKPAKPTKPTTPVRGKPAEPHIKSVKKKPAKAPTKPDPVLEGRKAKRPEVPGKPARKKRPSPVRKVETPASSPASPKAKRPVSVPVGALEEQQNENPYFLSDPAAVSDESFSFSDDDISFALNSIGPENVLADVGPTEASESEPPTVPGVSPVAASLDDEDRPSSPGSQILPEVNTLDSMTPSAKPGLASLLVYAVAFQRAVLEIGKRGRSAVGRWSGLLVRFLRRLFAGAVPFLRGIPPRILGLLRRSRPGRSVDTQKVVMRSLAPGRNRRRYLLTAVGVGVLFSGLVVALIWIFATRPKAGEGAESEPLTAAMIPSKSLQHSDGTEETPAAEAAASPDTPSASQKPAISKESPVATAANGRSLEMVTITLKGLPDDAKVYVGNQIYGTPVVLPRSRKAIKIEVTAPGMRRVMKRVVPSKDKTIIVKARSVRSDTPKKAWRPKRKQQKHRAAKPERQKRLASNPFGG